MASDAPGRPADDDVLMLRVAGGEVVLLGTLFDRHHGALHAFLGRATGSGPVADDLTQETFVRILRYRGTYRGDAPFGAWMYRIARRVLADHFARAAAVAAAPLSTDEREEPAAPATHPLETLEHAERRERVRRSFARLAPDRRELLVLARFQEMPYAAIAELLGCSVGAVKVRVHRALAELRALCAEPAGAAAREVRP